MIAKLLQMADLLDRLISEIVSLCDKNKVADVIWSEIEELKERIDEIEKLFEK